MSVDVVRGLMIVGASEVSRGIEVEGIEDSGSFLIFLPEALVLIHGSLLSTLNLVVLI